MFKSFLSETSGNVAMMFGGTVLLIMVGAGAAIDYGNMSKQKTQNQAMADAAVLAAAISGSEDPDELQQIANNAVNSNNFTGREVATQLSILDGPVIHVEVSNSYRMVMMSLLGIESKNILSFAQAPAKEVSMINLAMVLDVTDSMSGAKIDALKSAADSLVVDIMSEDTPAGPGDDDDDDDDDDGDDDDGDDDDGDDDGDGSASGDGVDYRSMVSVVPFARYVQLPMSTASEPWLEITLEENCSTPVDWDNSTGCSEEETSWTDDSGNTRTGTNTVCTNYAYKDEVCSTAPWNGCVGSRDFPWNTRDYFGGVRMRGLAKSIWCDDELLPLTTNVDDVRDKIASMDTNDRTYIPAGLIWGWRTLTPTMPFTEANTPDKHKRKSAMLLMSDGGNTRSFNNSDGYHWNTDVADANSITATLCNEIKADNILIYSVAYDFDDAAAKTILRNCASDPDKFFDAEDADALQSAFDDVARDLAQIRLSR